MYGRALATLSTPLLLMADGSRALMLLSALMVAPSMVTPAVDALGLVLDPEPELLLLPHPAARATATTTRSATRIAQLLLY